MKKLFSVLCVVALAAITANTASAGSINTPAGLKPGANFRIIFVTSTKTAATSSDLATYDSFVSADASGATYNGNNVSWKAIVSSVTINAKDHIGLQETSTTPIFRVDGTLVSTGNLWSQAHLAPMDQNLNSQYPRLVWTGTSSDGTSAIGNTMGMQSPITGYSSYIAPQWVCFSYDNRVTLSSLYGISDVLTVPSAVPEPSTVMLAGLGGLAAWAYSFQRKRNSCRRE